MINLRNALMAEMRLPYDAEVEYLESSGTQYIDTGYNFSGPCSMYLSASFLPEANERDLFGAYASGGNNMVCGCYARFIFGYNNPGVRIDSATFAASEADFDIEYSFLGSQGSGGARNLVVNGTTYTGAGVYYNNLSVTLFRANPNYTSKFKCRAFKIRDAQGNLVRDYIPVRKGTVGYLYDRVSGKLFGNAGTGDFVLGQDVIDITWGDGEYYGKNGSIGYNTNLARIDNYIAVTGGHSITWKWGDSVLGTCYLIVYNAQKQQIDYWSPNSATGERTINLNATGAFVRYSIGKNFKNTTFFKDNTTGLYAVRNGKILLP